MKRKMMYSAPLSDASEFCLRLGMTLATVYRCPRGDKLSPMVDHLQKRLILVQNFGFGIPKSPERKERGEEGQESAGWRYPRTSQVWVLGLSSWLRWFLAGYLR